MINIILAIAGPTVFTYLWLTGRRDSVRQQQGWQFILAGFGLIVFGILIGIIDSLHGAQDNLPLIGGPYQAYVEKMLGYLAGFALVAFGARRLIPNIMTRGEHRNALEDSHNRLESEFRSLVAETESKNEHLRQVITDQQCSSDALKQSQQEYQDLVEQSGTAICIVSDGMVDYVNPQMIRLTGHDPKINPGRPFTDYLIDEMRSEFTQATLGSPSDKSRPQHLESVMIDEDGHHAEVAISVSPIQLKGKPSLLLVIHDITSLKQAHKALQDRNQATEERIRQLQSLNEQLEHSQKQLAEEKKSWIKEQDADRQSSQPSHQSLEVDSFGIVHLDIQGRVIDVNPRAEEFIGYAKNELIGTELSQTNSISSNTALRMVQMVQKATEGIPSKMEAVQFKHSHGESHFIDLSSSLMGTPDLPAGVLITMADVTEHRRAIKSLEQANAELETRAQDRLKKLSAMEQEKRSRIHQCAQLKDELDELKLQWDAVIHNTRDIIATVDKDGTILFINQNASGIDPEAVIGSNIYDHLAPEHCQGMMESCRQVFTTGISCECNTVGRSPTHGYSCYQVRLAPIHCDGQIISATLIASDVTQKVGAEEAVRKAEERFRDLANLVPQTIFDIDLNGNFTFANNFGLHNTGYLQEDIDKGLNAIQLFSPQDQGRVMADIEKVLTGQDSGNHEYSLVRKDGSLFPVMAQVSPIIHDERIVGMRGIIMDITQRKKSEEEVARRNRELAVLNDIAQSVSQCLNLDEILSHALDKMMALLNFEQSGVYLPNSDTKRLELRLHKGIRGELLKAMASSELDDSILSTAAMSGQPLFVESIPDTVTTTTPADSTPHISGSIQSMACLPLQARGKTIGIMFVASDQPRMFSPEERSLLTTIGHEISTAAENSSLLEAESKAMALEEADRLRTAFLASISHEMRTPLTSIKGIASTLVQPGIEWDEETEKDFLLTINSETDKLVGIVNDLVDMSKIQAGIMLLEKRPTRIDRIIRQSTEKVKGQGLQHHLELIFADDLPLIAIDEIRMEQAITKLVNNAATSSPPDRKIVIETHRCDNEVKVSVIDQGEGIAAEDIPVVFDHFHRLEENTDRKMKGSALGLAICKGIIEAHGGHIGVESEQGCGATFTFSLPTSDDFEKSIERELLDFTPQPKKQGRA